LIDEKAVRDYQIRKKFKQLRSGKLSAGDAIDAIRAEYPYLQFDTIRKIVYQISK
jgi:MOSC domain-containing protein YiiM